MLPNYEIQIVPSGMTIYNPPMSDDAFNPAVGLTANLTNFEKEATSICLGFNLTVFSFSRTSEWCFPTMTSPIITIDDGNAFFKGTPVETR